MALDGALTVGMIFAFMSYKQQFLEKVSRLVEKGIDLRMLDLHLERLGDIALAKRERGHDHPPATPLTSPPRKAAEGHADRPEEQRQQDQCDQP